VRDIGTLADVVRLHLDWSRDDHVGCATFIGAITTNEVRCGGRTTTLVVARPHAHAAGPARPAVSFSGRIAVNDSRGRNIGPPVSVLALHRRTGTVVVYWLRTSDDAAPTGRTRRPVHVVVGGTA